MMQINLP